MAPARMEGDVERGIVFPSHRGDEMRHLGQLVGIDRPVLKLSGEPIFEHAMGGFAHRSGREE